MADRLRQLMGGRFASSGYTRLSARDEDPVPMDTLTDKSEPIKPAPKQIRRLPFLRLWTRNVIFTLITSAFYDFQLGAFTNIWSLFLSTPRYGDSSSDSASKHDKRALPLLFTGGLGMPASTVGFATSFLGIIGMLLQIFMYPPTTGPTVRNPADTLWPRP